MFLLIIVCAHLCDGALFTADRPRVLVVADAVACEATATRLLAQEAPGGPLYAYRCALARDMPPGGYHG